MKIFRSTAGMAFIHHRPIWDIELRRLIRTCNQGIKFHAGDGYIDHQPQEYDSLEDFLTSNQFPDVKEFIFGKAVLRTDSD